MTTAFRQSVALLAFRPKPEPDELFSSWLTRVAHEQGLKLQTFCHRVWPGKQIWNRDIDRCADDQLIADLALLTGTPLERALITTLRSYEGTLFERLNVNGNTRWLIPVGVYHRVRRRFGLQFCPQCIREKPYFRRLWRLSLVVTCTVHGRYLLDRCDKCSQPIQLHRSEMGVRHKIEPDDRICSWCGKSLIIMNQRLADSRLIAIQRTFELTINGHRPPFGTSAVEYFAVLSDLLAILASPRPWVRRFRCLVAVGSGLPLIQGLPRSESTVYFDHMDVTTRGMLLKSLGWLISDWPRRVLAVASISGARPTDLVRGFERHGRPEWLMELLRSSCPKYQVRLQPQFLQSPSHEGELQANRFPTFSPH